MRFVRAAREILNWGQSEFERRANLSRLEAEVLESKPKTVVPSVRDRVLRTLLLGGAGNPALIRGARGLLGATQIGLAEDAGVAPGTYRRFEDDSFTDADGLEATRTLAQVLEFLALKGISFTFSEQYGGAVAQKSLLRDRYLDFDLNRESRQ
jgi:transcriptional regulator with XRE-family HTH domain